MTRQSEQWRGAAFIQGGRKFLRDALYMPALVATRFNPDMKAKYQTMRKAGKPAKVAITKIMRKLTPSAIPCREIGPRRSSSTGHSPAPALRSAPFLTASDSYDSCPVEIRRLVDPGPPGSSPRREHPLPRASRRTPSAHP